MALSDRENLDLDENEGSNEKAIPVARRLPTWVGVSDKTLWDFLDLTLKVAIPVVLTFWGFQQTGNSTRIAREQEIKNQIRNEDDQHAKVIADYLEAMTKFMADPKQKEDEGSVEVIKARTLNTLSQLTNDPENDALSRESDYKEQSTNPLLDLLWKGSNDKLIQMEDSSRKRLSLKDSNRKGQLLKFLYDARLIRDCHYLGTKFVKDRKTCKSAIFKLDGAKLGDISSEFPMILPGIDLRKTRLYGAKLQDIDLSGAFLESAFLSDADLTGAQLASASMYFVHLERAKLPDAKLQNATLTYAHLKDANLSGANLRDANLTGADLRNVNFDHAILINAKLQGANLTGASLEKVKDFSGVECDSKTEFPSNFNRTGLGMGKSCQQN